MQVGSFSYIRRIVILRKQAGSGFTSCARAMQQTFGIRGKSTSRSQEIVSFSAGLFQGQGAAAEPRQDPYSPEKPFVSGFVLWLVWFFPGPLRLAGFDAHASLASNRLANLPTRVPCLLVPISYLLIPLSIVPLQANRSINLTCISSLPAWRPSNILK